MTTPEGRIKKLVKDVLHAQNVWYFMPVQMGYGGASLDFLPCIIKLKTGYPFPFFIETKKPGKKPTPRQDNLIEQLRQDYNCKVWLIDSELDVQRLELWLQGLRDL